MKRFVGTLFVKIYYIVSPSISLVLERNKPLNRVSKLILDGIIDKIKD